MALNSLIDGFKKASSIVLNPSTFPTFAALDVTTETFLVLEVTVIACFVVGFVTGNYSQVDKLWSIMPVIYVYMFASDVPTDPRMQLMFLAVGFWGVRLTLNFNRRGGYTWPPWLGEEDYRWAHIRKQYKAKEHPILFQIFHFVAICAWQMVILYMIALPAQVVHFYTKQNSGAVVPLNALDAIATLLILFLVSFEGKADNDQFEFQEKKYAMLNSGIAAKDLPAPYADGFLHTGLWALSRHPNYFAEQSVWAVLNLFVISATNGEVLLSHGVSGFVTLVIIFLISVDLQEGITKAKWPKYHKYIEQGETAKTKQTIEANEYTTKCRDCFHTELGCAKIN